MDDQRIKRRPLLRRKDFGHRLGTERIRREAINGLRRQRDDFTRPQQFASRCYRFFHFIIGDLEDTGLRHAPVVADSSPSRQLSFHNSPMPRDRFKILRCGCLPDQAHGIQPDAGALNRGGESEFPL